MRDINLLPDEARPGEVAGTGFKPNVSVKTVIAAVLILLVLGASLLIPRFYVKILDLRLTTVQNQLKNPAYEEVKTVNAKLQQIDAAIASKADIINFVDKQGYSASAVLNTIKQCLPEGCEIKEIGVNASVVTVSGKAPNSLAAAEFLLNIERIGCFSGIESVEGFKEARNNDKYPFQYTFSIVGKGGK